MDVFGLVAFIGYIVVFGLCQQVVGRRSGAHNNVSRREAPGKTFLACVCIIVLGFALRNMKHESPHYVLITIGLTLVVNGLVLSMWAQYALGAYWVGGVGLHKKHVLITTGPFRYVRHPMYSGILLSASGLGLSGWNILYLVALLCWAGGFFVRVIGEEYLLKERFKRGYPRYAARTGVLIPRIRKK